jgi:hypothetical protein
MYICRFSRRRFHPYIISRSSLHYIAISMPTMQWLLGRIDRLFSQMDFRSSGLVHCAPRRRRAHTAGQFITIRFLSFSATRSRILRLPRDSSALRLCKEVKRRGKVIVKFDNRIQRRDKQNRSSTASPAPYLCFKPLYCLFERHTSPKERKAVHKSGFILLYASLFQSMSCKIISQCFLQ